MKAMIAQAQPQPPQPQPPQPQPPQPQPLPGVSFDFLTSLGVAGLILTSVAIAITKTLPTFLANFFQLQTESLKAKIEAETQEAASDLQVNQSNYALINNIINTLLANQLQTSKQFQEEFVSVQQIQSAQIAIAQKDIERLVANQQRFFDLATQILAGQAEIKLEIERNRKVYQQRPRGAEPAQTQTPQLPNIPS
jgi:hypothetical protein